MRGGRHKKPLLLGTVQFFLKQFGKKVLQKYQPIVKILIFQMKMQIKSFFSLNIFLVPEEREKLKINSIWRQLDSIEWGEFRELFFDQTSLHLSSSWIPSFSSTCDNAAVFSGKKLFSILQNALAYLDIGLDVR